MLKISKTCLLIVVLTIVDGSCDNFTTSIPTTPIPLTPIIINSASYNTTYSKTINTTIEYVFLYNENKVNIFFYFAPIYYLISTTAIIFSQLVWMEPELTSLVMQISMNR